MKKLLEMLRWKRPSTDDFANQMFAERYLEPVFGLPDEFGNYITIVYNSDGSMPDVCFTAHYDTVHDEGGFQEIEIVDDIVTTVDGDCLGADCTTGIYLCLEMIDACIPGVYVIHAAEEIGCVGSADLVRSDPHWLKKVKAVISFDRWGTESIITHQCMLRTASDEFAKSLADALNMPQLKPDDGGVFTDSNEYRDIVSECTNISVGYYKQHTEHESQDLVYLAHLRDSLISADWSKLVFTRDPSVIEYDNYYSYGDWRQRYEESNDMWAYQDLYELIMAYPEELAAWFNSNGVTPEELVQEANLPDTYQRQYRDEVY